MAPAAGWRGDGSGAGGAPAAGAAAWRSWASPEKRAASVEAVSGGASITRPPCADRCTVSPAKSRCTSAAEGSGPGPDAAGAGAAEPVLHRRPGEHEAIGRIELLHRQRGLGGPVLDPLRLVEDDEIRPPGADEIQIADELLVVRDEEPPPPPADPAGAPQGVAGGDRLRGLAEAHVVGEQEPPVRKEPLHGLALVGVESLLERADRLHEAVQVPAALDGARGAPAILQEQGVERGLAPIVPEHAEEVVHELEPPRRPPGAPPPASRPRL